MTYQKLPFHPGVYKDDSPLEAKGYWIDADKVRFVRGLPETIYGWERASNSTLLGICRGAFTWADNSRNLFAAFGTNLQLYAMDADGNVTNITPVVSYGQVTNKITTTNGTATTINITAHGLVATQLFYVLSQGSAVGGITLSGSYPVTSVTDANNFVITTATATAAGPGGGILNYGFGLAPGQVDGLGGLGYGVGGYGSGTYGGSTSGYTLYPRTWSLTNWGQNLIANPRGGGIYEWAPNVTAVELNPDPTFATGWVLGTGWSQSVSVATAAANTSSALTASLPLLPGAHHLIMADITRSSGAVIVSVGSNTLTTIASTQHIAVSDYAGAGGLQTIAFTPSASFAGTVSNVSAKVMTYGDAIPNAPTQVTCAFVTSERILVACGCPNSGGTFDAMLINWTDTQNNETWTPAGTNLAGAYTLSNGSRIVKGIPGTRGNLILTDAAAYTMVFNADPTIVYSFTEVGSSCGLIGPNAVCQVGGIFYWMDAVGGFWAYDGTVPTPLMCTLGRDVHDNLSYSQQDKVYAFPVTVAGRVEVWFLYPDIRDGNECSRYVIYSVTESQSAGIPVWSCGTFNRTAWVNSGIFQYPLAVDSSGSIWFQEKGFTQDGGARSWSASTAFFDLADDGTQMRIKNIQPDVEDLQGGYNITINTKIRNRSGILARAFGPYMATATTGKINVRASGEEAQLVFSATTSPAFWRMGAYRHDIEAMGRMR